MKIRWGVVLALCGLFHAVPVQAQTNPRAVEDAECMERIKTIADANTVPFVQRANALVPKMLPYLTAHCGLSLDALNQGSRRARDRLNALAADLAAKKPGSAPMADGRISDELVALYAQDSEKVCSAFLQRVQAAPAMAPKELEKRMATCKPEKH